MDGASLGRGTRGLALLLGGLLACLGCAEEIYEERFAEGQIDLYDDLYAATAVGSDHLWASGYFGAIYHTGDGGRSWRKLDSTTEKSIYDISFADEQNGWAVGRRGWIIHTRDGGETWERQETPRFPPQHIFAVHAIDGRRAWAVGEWGGRYYTDDAGQTWQDRSFLISEDHPAFRYLTDFELERFYKGEKVYDDLYLNDVTFVDETHGWIVGEYGLTYYTSNGGETWEQGKIVGEVVLDDVPFDPMSADIPRTRWPQLFKAAEDLLAKEYLRVRIEGFMTSRELAAKDGETYLADERAEAVRDFLEGEGVGQERVRLQNTTPFGDENVDMKVFARTKLRDTPYVHIRIVETPFLFDVKFRDRTNGLVAGLGGVIMRSTDGGVTWRYQQSQSRLAFYAVGFGSNASLAVGERGLGRVSLDGGFHWDEPQDGFPTLFTYMRDLVFAERDRGWIVGGDGLVLRSSDGGRSWHQVLPPPPGGIPADGARE